MRRFFRSAAFPILIVIVLAFFAQRLISGPSSDTTPTYDQFIPQVKNQPSHDQHGDGRPEVELAELGTPGRQDATPPATRTRGTA